jgi:hypothetical protein
MKLMKMGLSWKDRDMRAGNGTKAIGDKSTKKGGCYT